MRERLKDKLEDSGFNEAALMKRLEERKELLYVRRIKYHSKKDELKLGKAQLMSKVNFG